MVYILLLVSVSITLILINLGKSFRISYSKITIKQSLIKYSLEFFIPLTIVTFFYSLISISILIFANSFNLEMLIKCEVFISKFRAIVAIFKPTPFQVILILLALYSLTLLRLLVNYVRILTFLDKYQVIIRRFYITLIILSSFTFLGNQFGNPIYSDLEIRIKSLREGYAEIRSEVKDIITDEIYLDLYENILEKLPKSYNEAKIITGIIEDQIDSLNKLYRIAITVYGVRSEYAANIIDQRERRERYNDDFKKLVEGYQENKSEIESGKPNNQVITKAKIEKIKVEIERIKTTRDRPSIKFFEKIVLQSPKILTNIVGFPKIRPFKIRIQQAP